METSPQSMIIRPEDWLEVAKSQLGVREIPGDEHNPEVLKYWEAVNYEAHTDEVPWCAAFVNWVFWKYSKAFNFKIFGTQKANARSFLNWGKSVKDNPVPGSVCVFWRGSPWGSKGHVGFYLGKTLTSIIVLGGNQGNIVSVKKYSRLRLLDIRVPITK